MKKVHTELKALACTALLSATGAAHSATAVIQIEGFANEYSGPPELAAALGGIQNLDFTVEINLPRLSDFEGMTSVNFDGNMENGPGLSIRSGSHVLLEGQWMQLANPNYDPNEITCAPWTEPTCSPAQNQPMLWNMDVDYDGIFGEATLYFDENGAPSRFEYFAGRDVMSTFDENIQARPGLEHVALSEISIVADDFTLDHPLNSGGWGIDAGSVIYFSAENSYATMSALDVSSVPVPAAVWLFGSGLLGLVGVARRVQR